MQTPCQCGENIFNENKYCSKQCFYKFRIRPKGLTYKITKENPTSFKKGHKAWNTGLAGTGICKPNAGSIKKGQRRGLKTEFISDITINDKNINWMGDKVGYGALHSWVNRKLGKAKECSHCGESKRRIEWANKSHEYKRDLEDWLQLCKRCHMKYDKNYWGVATKKYGLNEN